MTTKKPHQASQASIVDPCLVSETLCDGPLNVQFADGRALITFTRPRPKPAPLIARGEIDVDLVVRARIAFSMANLIALRDLLNRLVPNQPSSEERTTGTGGAKLH